MIDIVTSPASTETDLIHAARHGDRAAFGELVRRHCDGVINVVYRMCGDPDLAEEAAQEAFLRAWQNLGRYNPKFPFRNWVYRIAINAALDALRREPQKVDLEGLPLHASNGQPEKSYEDRERTEQVRQALQALPPNSRAVMVLREYQGLSYKEIASTLGIPIGTVMSRLNYARNQLRQALSAYLEVT